MPPARRTQADRREAAEKAILDAALALVAKRGVKGMTLGEVGEAAGFSKGIATHYFKTKDRLLQATAEYVSDQYGKLLGSPSTKPGLETIMHFLDISCTPRRLEMSRAIHLIQKEAFFDASSLKDVYRKYNRGAFKRIENEIRIGIQKNEIRKDADPKLEAIMLLALTRGLRAQWLTAPDKFDLPKMKSTLLRFVRSNLVMK